MSTMEKCTTITENEIVFEYPEIRLRRWHKAEYKQLITNYFDSYNEDKPSRDQLKAPHKQLLLELVFYAHIVIERDSKELSKDGVEHEITSQSWIRVDLNRFRLSRELHRSPDSVKRYKRRLAESGSILSSQEDFDRVGVHKGRRNHVLINPDLLLIYDRFNPEYQPTSPYLSLTEIQAIQKFKGANCIGVSSTTALQEQLNNEIRDVETVSKRRFDEISKQSTGTIKHLQEHPPKLNGSQREHQKSSAKKGNKIENNSKIEVIPASPEVVSNSVSIENPQPAQKSDKLAVLRRAFAVELYVFLVHFLFRNHSVYRGEEINTIAYIERVYAANLQSEEQAEMWMKQYKWRLQKAAKYIETHKYDTSNIYPLRYVNVKNTDGFSFINTRQWWLKHQADMTEKAQNREINAQKLLEMQLYSACLDECKLYPSLSIVKKQMEIIQDKVPHLLQDFRSEVGVVLNA